MQEAYNDDSLHISSDQNHLQFSFFLITVVARVYLFILCTVSSFLIFNQSLDILVSPVRTKLALIIYRKSVLEILFIALNFAQTIRKMKIKIAQRIA